MPLAAVTVLHAGTFAVTALVAMTWLPWLLWIMFGIVAASGPVLLTHAIGQNRDLPAREGYASAEGVTGGRPGRPAAHDVPGIRLTRRPG
jgi:hypothetical protein